MSFQGTKIMSSLFKQLGYILLLVLATASLAHAERKTTYYHTDALGSVVAASNDAGALLWRKEYAPFGEQTDSTAENEKLAYTGKQHDDVTGLTYFGARHYDPHLGRFMSVDPVGFVDSEPMTFNRYSYANNNPYKNVDPDGEFVNFAAKFVLDVGVNVAFNYVTTGELNVGGALKESAVGIFNPAKTVAKAGKLVSVLGAAKKAQHSGAGKVLVDSNAVVTIGKDPTLGGRLASGEQAMVSYVTRPELQNVVARGKLKGMPRSLDNIEVYDQRPSIDEIINFRGGLTRKRGKFGDGIIGAQAVKSGMPLVTNDRELAQAVRAAGGTVR
jgi:RHS repeat-associated protein